MSSNTITVIPIPCDPDGFFPRECPSCKRQFRSWPELNDLQWTEEPRSDANTIYYCPYCVQPAGEEQWYTPEQSVFVQQQAFALLVTPGLQQLQTTLHTLLPSAEPIEEPSIVSSSINPIPHSTLPHDLLPIQFPCHQQKPIEIDGNWWQDVACLSCGMLYSIDQVVYGKRKNGL